MQLVGYAGFSWTTSIPTTADMGHRVYDLDFSHGGLNPDATTVRAHGLQLRCLQE
ncbi:MAG: hypothetical protein K2K83_06110 [Rikenella sp.]|nr:hypothetical protein [Rikenella sp.]